MTTYKLTDYPESDFLNKLNTTFLSNPEDDLTKKEFEQFFGKDSPTHIIQAPFEYSTSCMKGTQFGPQSVLNWSSQIEFFNLLSGDESVAEKGGGIHTRKPLQLKNLGVQKALTILENEVNAVGEENKFPVVLGGEHTITYVNVMAYSKLVTGPISMVFFDSHPDLYDNLFGNSWSHACVVKRLLDTLGNRLSVYFIGLREMNIEEYELMNSDDRIHYVTADKANKLSNYYEGFNGKLKGKNIWLSIDVDGFDPSIVPSTGTPVVGGLLWYETMDFLKKVFSKNNVGGVDVVEHSPNASKQGYSSKAVAQLVYNVCVLHRINNLQ